MANGLFSNKDEGLTQEEYDIITDVRSGNRAEKIALAKSRNLKLNAGFQKGVQQFSQQRNAVLRGAGEATEQARIQPDFSSEQRMLGQLFGGGEKVWGTELNPVTLNNDLNPSRSNPRDETAGMFGFGGNGERSGLF